MKIWEDTKTDAILKMNNPKLDKKKKELTLKP